MSAKAEWGKGWSILGYGAAAFGFGLVAFQSLNVAADLASETTGVVQGSAFVPADGPAPSKNVWVRLSDGGTVVINTPTDLVLKPGQEVKLRVYERLITKTKSYAIARPETAK